MILFCGLALAAPRLWLQGAALAQLGVAEPAPVGGGVGGEIGVHVGAEPVLSLAAGASEAVITAPNSHAAGIYVDVRWPARTGPYVLGGFAHQHVTGLDSLKEAPGQVFLATHEAVSHRSGFSVGAGVAIPSFWPEDDPLGRVHAELRGRMMVLPAGDGPLLVGLVELGGRIEIGKD